LPIMNRQMMVERSSPKPIWFFDSLYLSMT
jgi:hypothetical protein